MLPSADCAISGLWCEWSHVPFFLLTFTIFLFSPLTEDTQQEPGEAWKRNFLITASRTKGPSVHQRNSDSPSPLRAFPRSHARSFPFHLVFLRFLPLPLILPVLSPVPYCPLLPLSLLVFFSVPPSLPSPGVPRRARPPLPRPRRQVIHSPRPFEVGLRSGSAEAERSGTAGGAGDGRDGTATDCGGGFG